MAPANNDWLLTQSQHGGYLTNHKCHKSLQSVIDALNSLNRVGGYTHDKLVAELSFGFWRYQFASHEFRAAGSTLHLIFVNRPRGTNHTDIFNKLGNINKLRNRIAHHEPVCFGPGNTVSGMYAKQHYDTILELLQWMDIDAISLLRGMDGVPKEILSLNTI